MNLSKIKNIADIISTLARVGECRGLGNDCRHEVEESMRVLVTLLNKQLQP